MGYPVDRDIDRLSRRQCMLGRRPQVRSRLLTAAVLWFAAAVPAWAGGPDVMAVAFDPQGTLTCADQITAGGDLSVYLLLLDASQPQVSAWECRLEWDQMGGTFVGAWELANNGLNIGDLSDPADLLFAVGTGAQPIATGGVTVLAHWSGLFLSGSGSRFYLHPYPGTQSFPDEQLPGYAADAATLVPCQIASGDESAPVALLGSACAGSEDLSWSDVKNRYQ